MVAGRFGHVGLCQLCTEQYCVTFCRTFQPCRPLSTAYKLYTVLYAVNEVLCLKFHSKNSGQYVILIGLENSFIYK